MSRNPPKSILQFVLSKLKLILAAKLQYIFLKNEFLSCALSIGLGLVLIYHINQYLGHNKPFPHTLISDVARHYP